MEPSELESGVQILPLALTSYLVLDKLLLQARGQQTIQPTTQIHPHSPIFVLTHGYFCVTQQQSSYKQNQGPTKPEIFAIWPFPGKVYQPLL